LHMYGFFIVLSVDPRSLPTGIFRLCVSSLPPHRYCHVCVLQVLRKVLSLSDEEFGSRVNALIHSLWCRIIIIYSNSDTFLALGFKRHSSQHERDWCYKLLHTEDRREARRQTRKHRRHEKASTSRFLCMVFCRCCAKCSLSLRRGV